MKILFVINSLRKGGAERLLVNICNELAEDTNFSIAIFILRNENSYKSNLNKKVQVFSGNTSLHLSLYKKDNIENKDYINFVNDFKPQIIHSHLFWADILVHSYYYPNSAYISHIHSSNINELKKFRLKDSLKKRTWTNLYEKSWILKRYKLFNTNFIACSNGAIVFHKENIRTGRLNLIPNAIPLPKIDYVNQNKSSTLKLLWVGTFTKVKNPVLAIKIACELKKNSIDFHLSMAGSGLLLKDCKSLVENLMLQDKVAVLGETDSIDEEYKKADCLLHTSEYEGLPMVFIEAMSYGLPIITTNCLVDNDIVENGVNGEIITHDTKEFLVEIKKLANSPLLLAKLSNGALTTSKTYNIKNYINKLKLKYNDLIRK